MGKGRSKDDMDENIKKLPAGQVKKMLLNRQLDMDSLDEEMILWLLDYEICYFVNDIGETEFYRMCMKALSKFVDFHVEDKELDAVVSSAYFLCFSKKEQRCLLKRLQKKNSGDGEKKPRQIWWSGIVICMTAALLLLAVFLTVQYDVFSKRAACAYEFFGHTDSAVSRVADGAPHDKEFIKGIYIHTDVESDDCVYLQTASPHEA